MRIGARPGGTTNATSLTAPCWPVPVLSPTLQPAGIPARKRSVPVSQAFSHATSWPRLARESKSPHNARHMRFAIALGDVVSRASHGTFSFSVGSLRSSRVTASPVCRMKSVRPEGPPTFVSSRLAAVLSLFEMAAFARASTVIVPSATCARVVGAYSRRPEGHWLVHGELPAINPGQNRGAQHPLERGTESESLVGAMCQPVAAARVEREDADAPTDRRFNIR